MPRWSCVDDADLDAAVQTTVYDEFPTRFTGAARAVTAADPTVEGTLIGPVVNDAQLATLKAEDEAHAAFGGERNSGLGRFNGGWAIDEFTTSHTIGVTRI